MSIEMTAILAGTIAAATPLIFAGLGELVAERTGVINLGVEGMMLVGAIAGFAFAAHYEASVASALLVGALAGMFMSLIFAFFTLSLSTNQSACGLALTIFGIGISAFIGQNYVSMALPGLQNMNIPGLADIPFIGPVLFQQNYVVYLSILAFVVIWWVLAKTRLGLLLKAVGESPESAHAMGYNVLAIRYCAVLFGGAMAGVGGAFLSTVYTPMWIENMVAGRGWIAIALVVFATWKPTRLMLGAYLFGGVTILQFHAQALGLNVPNELLSALPYVATIVVLVIISRDKKLLKMNLPASLGKTFTP
ncbi:ABC transporter permease [Acinetobacter sp. SwsAc6]|uniref:ABC transporter permease n=1 Tax=Acinetobacter cumulans TaxID=2136182 RepID=A0A498CZ94_9GAMM|nr:MULTISPECIES: ABC transporter permease [Acinetobacter]NWK74220.1 ABC transporter permease [Acinetobacter sp. SwsAc6]RKG46831.1 ABC transporter permease [Acinetobacter cumulans]RKG49681.1 ABC transporter permease [Acinetobacter cumulans]RLL37632.1 ABC transporter permease [Acinetobacter cumulans]RZG62224.1 ABC transporter permease [Acinetobacter sp. WCHAc060006]